MEEPDRSSWLASNQNELANHQRYQTWELVDYLKVGAHVISCYVLFKVKEVNGELVRKTRIVAGGDKQTEDEFDQWISIICASFWQWPRNAVGKKKRRTSRPLTLTVS